MNKEKEELNEIREKLYKYAQLELNADEMKVLIKKVRDISNFMHENRMHIASQPEIKINLGFDKNYTDPEENLLVNNMLRELNHTVTYDNFYTSYVDLYWNLEKAYRKIVKYEMRIDAINAQQVAINDQILKLGIVKGVNK
jgi:hypothetical protein